MTIAVDMGRKATKTTTIYGSEINLPYTKATVLRKETFLKYIVKAKNIQPGQTQHSVSSDLVQHCLHMSYLQTIRQLVTWTQSRPDWDTDVLSYKRKINLERKYFLVTWYDLSC